MTSWATGMDSERRSEAQDRPSGSRLAEIDAIADSAAIAGFLKASAARGENPLFGFGPEADFKNSSMNIAFVTQGGLGLPDKATTPTPTRGSTAQAYIAKVHSSSQVSPPTTPPRPGRRRDRLRAVSRASNRVGNRARRLPSLQPSEPGRRRQADAALPPGAPSSSRRGSGLPRYSHLGHFHQEVDAMIAGEPVEHWKSYLRFHLVDDAAQFLSSPFVQENFRFWQQT
ncbi:MAG: hypothetical protein R2862_07815 [Thermoanaerobaculia bacterium]